jgi:hypothetical protein
MSHSFRFASRIHKTDAAKMQATGVIYRANEIDSQGDFMSPETLERVAHAALAKGVRVDIGHDQRDTGSKLVESHIEGNAWIGTVQLTKEVWPFVESGKYKAFSVGGHGDTEPRVLKDGTKANEIVRADIDWISVVEIGANRETFIAKSDTAALAGAIAQLGAAVAALHEQSADLDEQIERLRDRSPLSSGTSVRKSAAVRKAQEEAEVRTHQLVAKQAVLNQRLDSIRETSRGVGSQELAIVRELDAIEAELESLRVEKSSPFEAPENSAFVFRGGTSQVLDMLPSDSAWDRRRGRVSKADEDAISLNTLKL